MSIGEEEKKVNKENSNLYEYLPDLMSFLSASIYPINTN
jgi:hypothetical protein